MYIEAKHKAVKFQQSYTLALMKLGVLWIFCDIRKCCQVDKSWEEWGDWNSNGKVIVVDDDSSQKSAASCAVRTMLKMFERMHFKYFKHTEQARTSCHNRYFIFAMYIYIDSDQRHHDDEHGQNANGYLDGGSCLIFVWL